MCKPDDSNARLTMLACIVAVTVLVGSELACAAPQARTDCPDVAPPGGDGSVDVQDLLAVLSAWGESGVPEDVNGDGIVDVLDLLAVLAAWGPCAAEPVQIQLAGNALSTYPYFEFVSAVNEGSPVQIAVDPAHVPDSPSTCDVYIVAARTDSEWSSDPSLVDVRGAPETVVLEGDTIQANTFVMTGGEALGGDAGTGVGVGYDVVCDFNSNATLDAGDLIDGWSAEAGFYVVDDLTEPGPLETSVADYEIVWMAQRQHTVYPSEISSLGALPLVVISHGAGHEYTWYEYLQEHLASHGCIVMAHQNYFWPGESWILQHTDAFLEELDSIAGGVMDGHVDPARIVWIGHSYGGRDVIVAYDKLRQGTYAPLRYGLESIRLVSVIAANSGAGVADGGDPHDVPFHVLYGSADGDIDGSPGCDACQPFRYLDRAAGFKQSTYVHGADHNDFNCCGVNDFEGPPETEIGRAESQRIAKAVYLALVKHYAEASIPARDYLWRQWERFRPLGVSETTTVVNTYRRSAEAGSFVVDDYQSEPDAAVSSSGGSVAFDVLDLVEGRLHDTDGVFSWHASDPMNGMTNGGSSDTTRGVVFHWSGQDRFLEFEIVPGMRDLSQLAYLSFRACQGTRHPETTAELGDLTFAVTLEDGSGHAASINTGSYGGGIEEPYPRTGAGGGAGWLNEWETIRIRLTDFLHNGTDLDLSDIVSIRFDFGPTHGSSRGRLGLDDIEVTRDEGAVPASSTGATRDDHRLPCAP